MATLLAHIQIQPGKEEKWEAIMHDMVHHTFGTEEGVIRYEYWKGQSRFRIIACSASRTSGRSITTRCPTTTKATISPTCWRG